MKKLVFFTLILLSAFVRAETFKTGVVVGLYACEAGSQGGRHIILLDVEEGGQVNRYKIYNNASSSYLGMRAVQQAAYSTLLAAYMANKEVTVSFEPMNGDGTLCGITYYNELLSAGMGVKQ